MSVAEARSGKGVSGSLDKLTVAAQHILTSYLWPSCSL